MKSVLEKRIKKQYQGLIENMGIDESYGAV